jgi:hypothetical protein
MPFALCSPLLWYRFSIFSDGIFPSPAFLKRVDIAVIEIPDDFKVL